MLSKLIKRSFAGATKQRGNFEIHYNIPPRYFMVTYDIDSKVDCKEMLSSSEYDEHRAIIKKQVQNQSIIMNGETLDMHDDDNTNFS